MEKQTHYPHPSRSSRARHNDDATTETNGTLFARLKSKSSCRMPNLWLEMRERLLACLPSLLSHLFGKYDFITTPLQLHCTFLQDGWMDDWR